jgi:hypothetical protein
MSLSEMNKQTYKAHAQSIRANGERHGLKWIACPLEREDMAFLCNQSYDHLLQRLAFRKLGKVETPRNAFLLTTPLFYRLTFKTR